MFGAVHHSSSNIIPSKSPNLTLAPVIRRVQGIKENTRRDIKSITDLSEKTYATIIVNNPTINHIVKESQEVQTTLPNEGNQDMKMVKIIKLKANPRQKPPKPEKKQSPIRNNSLARLVSTGDLLSKTA